MAKTFKPKTTGITVDDENTTGDGVEVVSDTKEESVENLVETVETVKTETIGGVRYFLKKGVHTNVPQEVKDILNKSGLLMPL